MNLASNIKWLTFVSSDCIHQLDFRVKFAHLLDDLARLESELVCRRHTQALRQIEEGEAKLKA